ncbi:hypothetical protein EZS27_020746 [termite gut metagenome]|uniref:Uncharacterized protein n=1 Tax=termite gut metagenome TaxID=433724 RepID=A0A5J4RC57_9ZZZZ
MNEIIEIAATNLRDEALKLHRDKQMDFLEDLIGMEWGDTLGVIYYLESTITGERTAIKTRSACPNIPCDNLLLIRFRLPGGQKVHDWLPHYPL